MKKTVIITILAFGLPLAVNAQRVITLEECRQMAVEANKELEEARQKTLMAEYDKKIALTNYFPSITASGTYMHNSKDLSLVSENASSALTSIGSTVQGQISSEMQNLMTSIMGNPSAFKEYKNSPMWQTVIGKLSQTDVSNALNTIGTSINDALHFDISNVYAGIVSIQQPLFMGGKIIASNQMAQLAKELSMTEYDLKVKETQLQAERDYWQVVSLASKKRLAQVYLDLLKQMEKDAQAGVDEGVAIQSDLLAVRVKKNEAQMLLTKAENGLALSKMLMCKQIGLPLDTDIRLADEGDDAIPKAEQIAPREMSAIIAERQETRMLELATKIYDKKVAFQRADFLPKLALTGNYLITNPNAYNGFKNEFGGMFNVGVALSVPIFHATEGIQKTKKAKAEANMYRIKYEDACQMVNLQVEQLYRQQQEAFDKLEMSESNLVCAEENLRAATLGFEEGVINSDVALQAQTAWVKAQTEYIDAGIELQLTHSEFLQAQALYK